MIPNFDSMNVTKRYQKNFHNKKGHEGRKKGMVRSFNVRETNTCC